MGRPAEALSWNFACPDWVERLRQSKSLLPSLPLNDNEAERAVSIFNNLRLPDVPGQPMMSEAAGEWGRDIVRAIFGSLVDGERKVREVLALVPKKNAKTTNGAAIGVTALLMNERPRADFVLVGPTQEIADTAFQQASGMIDADPYLKQRFHVADHRKAIFDRVLKSTLKIKTFDMKVATGSKPVMVLIDELHLMGSISYASRVIGQLRGGMIANPEAFLVIITTQSDQAPAGAFKTELDYARGVRDGRIVNSRMLPLLYEFPEEMQTDQAKPWQDPRNWHMVLPNLGRSITLERLVEEYQAAVDKGAEEERRWASQHLNVQIGLALHTDRWRGADYWEAAIDRTLTLATLLARCEVVVVGVDGGGLDDLYGLCVAGREKETKRWLYWFRGWVYREVLEMRHEIAPRLMDFERDGDLVIIGHNGGPPLDDDADDDTPPTELMGDEQDVREIVAIIEQVKDSGLLPDKGAIGLDPEGVGALVDALADIGLVHPQVVGVTQGYRLASAVWSLERKLKHRMAVHSGAPLINWCVGNAKAEQRGNAVIITKQAAGKAKIDPFMAGLNATKLLEANPAAQGGSLDDFIAAMKAA
ncbi:terminase large subunit [Sphingobium sp.]|uniref:terminase large subunit n=1 Tax=Sphingobium sp. TaxID=1912891 RepID=UPI003BB67210